MTERPGGAPFMNRLPQSVIDRHEAEQSSKTAAKAPAVHFVGNAHVSRAACGRLTTAYYDDFVAPETTSDREAVTCRACLNAMPKTAGRPDESYDKSICIMALPAPQAAACGIGNEEEKHATVLYFGDRGEHLPVGEVGKALMQEAVEKVAAVTMPFGAVVTGIEALGDDEPQAQVWLLRSPTLHSLFRSLREARPEVSDMYDVATANGVTRYPDFKPHVTIGYGEVPEEAHRIASIPFDRLSLWWGDERHDFPLGG